MNREQRIEDNHSEATKAWIRQVWTLNDGKRIRFTGKDRKPSIVKGKRRYPGSVSKFLKIVIDGKARIFRIAAWDVSEMCDVTQYR